MAQASSRDTLIDFCLRRLGAPVIDINVDLDQIEDKIDDAIQLFYEYHDEGIARSYIAHQITTDDVANKYIALGDDVVWMTRMIPVSSGSGNFFDVKYQMMLNDITAMNSFIGDMSYYYQVQQYMRTIDQMLVGAELITYSRKQNRVYIHGEWSDGELSEGDWIVFEVFRAVDFELYGRLWNNMFIKDYTTALIKQQWGANLMKFEGMSLPGGIQFNGRQIYEDATQEIEQLRERVRLEYESPIDFLVG